MTVNFTNTVSTSDIKIIKKVTTDNSDNKVDRDTGDNSIFISCNANTGLTISTSTF